MNAFKSFFTPLSKSFNNLFICLTLFAFYFLTAILSAKYAILLGRLSESIEINESIESWSIFSIIFVLLIMMLLQIIISYLVRRLKAKISLSYKEYSINKIARSSVAWINGQQQGELYSKLTNDLNTAANFIGNDFWSLYGKFISILVSISAVFIIQYKVALVLILIFIVAIIIQIIVSKSLQSYRKNLFMALGENAGIQSDLIQNTSQIIVYRKSDWALGKFKSSLKKISKTYIKMIPSVMMSVITASFCSMLPLILTAVYCVELYSTAQMTLSMVVAVITLAMPLSITATQLLQEVTAIRTDLAALFRMESIWNAPNEECLFKQSDSFQLINKSNNEILKIEEMEFQYNSQEKPVLQNITYSFKRGRIYILTGANGSGKSTLTKLIAALFLPKKGKLYYYKDYPINEADNKDRTDDSTLYEIRNFTTIAEQEPYLFNGTILQNILSSNGIVPADALDWMRNSLFSKAFQNLPEQENTLVEDGGSNLSGGQRRCISIARTFYKQPEFMILDEPTANVDETISELIIQSINNYIKDINKTVLIITHDPVLITKLNCAEHIDMETLNKELSNG